MKAVLRLSEKQRWVARTVAHEKVLFEELKALHGSSDRLQRERHVKLLSETKRKYATP
ncbi:MAG: hypothetical protein WAK20_09025 [Candidatus Acidiferrum sp.]